MKLSFVALFMLFCIGNSPLIGFNVESEPYAIAYTPNSILQEKERHIPEFAGMRSRYSTCTGVFWFPNNKKLGVISFLNASLQFYEFNEKSKVLKPKECLTNEKNYLHHPENLAISKDGKLLAIACNGTGALPIYRMDSKRNVMPMEPATYLGNLGDVKLHGVSFSWDNCFLGYVTLDEPGNIRMHRINQKYGNYTFEITQNLTNPQHPLKPKSIDFSIDGRYVVIVYCVRIVRGQKNVGKGAIVVYNFDREAGTIDPNPVSILTQADGIISAETVKFHPSGTFIAVTSQIEDKVMLVDFDRKTGVLDKNYITLSNPVSQLDFPHGLEFSLDGKFMAVTNYGDDKIAVFRILK